jgi:hypothetical protein
MGHFTQNVILMPCPNGGVQVSRYLSKSFSVIKLNLNMHFQVSTQWRQHMVKPVTLQVVDAEFNQPRVQFSVLQIQPITCSRRTLTSLTHITGPITIEEAKGPILI